MYTTTLKGRACTGGFPPPPPPPQDHTSLEKSGQSLPYAGHTNGYHRQICTARTFEGDCTIHDEGQLNILKSFRCKNCSRYGKIHFHNHPAANAKGCGFKLINNRRRYLYQQRKFDVNRSSGCRRIMCVQSLSSLYNLFEQRHF